jgi:CubicO group peptidase (beta-lactamase class C family)
VTIAMLMQHRAGFAKTAPPPIWERLENGPETKKGVGFRKYSNTSASMFQNMPTFFDPHTAHFVEETLKAVKESVYDPEISKQAKLIYQAYVQENIWKPLGIKALCNDTNFARKNYAMYYKSPEDEKGKLVQPDPENPKCAPGGWILAALAMSKFAHALTATDAIISPENYALMANTADTSQRLGWASVHPFADGTGFSHNGSRWNGKAKGQMTVFPNGLTAVGVANSKPPQGVSFRKLFNQAYEAALS